MRQSWVAFVPFCLLLLTVQSHEVDAGDVPDLQVAVTPCPPGWTYFSHLDQCYYISDLVLPFQEASDFCLNVTGGELLTLYSKDEYDRILKYIHQNDISSLYPYWISLVPYTLYPYFRWQGNYPMNYTHWINNNANPGPVTDTCVSWRTVGEDGWQLTDCKYAQPFICKQPSANCPTVQLNGANGTFTSSNYPQPYDLNSNCIYHITVSEGKSVKLFFNDIDIDYFSTIYIYDGPTTDSLLIDYVTDIWGLFFYYVSTANAMTLRFSTGSTYMWYAEGWSATFTSINSTTPIYLNGTAGGLTSPGYPGNYTDEVDLLYKIVGPKNTRLAITVWDFKTERAYDWLTIANDEFETTASKSLIAWSGDHSADVPKTVYTSDNVAALVWHADEAVHYTGWNITWVAQPIAG